MNHVGKVASSVVIGWQTKSSDLALKQLVIEIDQYLYI